MSAAARNQVDDSGVREPPTSPPRRNPPRARRGPAAARLSRSPLPLSTRRGAAAFCSGVDGMMAGEPLVAEAEACAPQLARPSCIYAGRPGAGPLTCAEAARLLEAHAEKSCCRAGCNVQEFVITELVAQRREVGRVEDAESSSSRLLQSLLPLLDKRVSQALLVKILFLVADIAASSSLPASNLQAGVRALLRLLQNQVEGAAAPATLPATLAALLKLSAHDDLSREVTLENVKRIGAAYPSLEPVFSAVEERLAVSRATVPATPPLPTWAPTLFSPLAPPSASLRRSVDAGRRPPLSPTSSPAAAAAAGRHRPVLPKQRSCQCAPAWPRPWDASAASAASPAAAIPSDLTPASPHHHAPAWGEKPPSGRASVDLGAAPATPPQPASPVGRRALRGSSGSSGDDTGLPPPLSLLAPLLPQCSEAAEAAATAAPPVHHALPPPPPSRALRPGLRGSKSARPVTDGDNPSSAAAADASPWWQPPPAPRPEQRQPPPAAPHTFSLSPAAPGPRSPWRRTVSLDSSDVRAAGIGAAAQPPLPSAVSALAAFAAAGALTRSPPPPRASLTGDVPPPFLLRRPSRDPGLSPLSRCSSDRGPADAAAAAAAATPRHLQSPPCCSPPRSPALRPASPASVAEGPEEGVAALAADEPASRQEQQAAAPAPPLRRLSRVAEPAAAGPAKAAAAAGGARQQAKKQAAALALLGGFGLAVLVALLLLRRRAARLLAALLAPGPLFAEAAAGAA